MRLFCTPRSPFCALAYALFKAVWLHTAHTAPASRVTRHVLYSVRARGTPSAHATPTLWLPVGATWGNLSSLEGRVLEREALRHVERPRTRRPAPHTRTERWPPLRPPLPLTYLPPPLPWIRCSARRSSLEGHEARFPLNYRAHGSALPARDGGVVAHGVRWHVVEVQGRW